MNNHKVDRHTYNLRKRKRIHDEVATDDARVKKPNATTTTGIGIDKLPVKKQDTTTTTEIGIDKLPDDMLIAILSRMSLKEAARTSVLSSRWRNLWTSTSRDLVFDAADTSGGAVMKMEKFADMVDYTLKLYEGTGVDSLSIRFSNIHEDDDGVISHSIYSWVYFAMLKQVKKFELDLSVAGGYHYNYEFPEVLTWLLRFPPEKWFPLECKSKNGVRVLRSLGAFRSLRSLRLVHVDISDTAVCYFLSSCPVIEELSIRASNTIINLQVVDPPSLKVLEIVDCPNIKSLVISSTNLVSCTYIGKKISSPFKNVPNLSDLTLGGKFCTSFIYEPNKHSSYSLQLGKLVLNLQTASFFERQIGPIDLPQLHGLKRLELNVVSQVGRSLLFFISLIKASPRLHEFKLKIDYLVARQSSDDSMIRERLMPFPKVTSTEEYTFEHKNLKVVKIEGYCGCESEEQFVVQLCNIASLEKVLIDTDCDYYLDHAENCVAMYRLRKDGKNPMSKRMRKAEPMANGAMTPFLAKKHARKLRSTCNTNFVIT
ncbi:hypothetical protein ABFS83_09G119700 [Erythranthe nasuta]